MAQAAKMKDAAQAQQKAAQEAAAKTVAASRDLSLTPMPNVAHPATAATDNQAVIDAAHSGIPDSLNSTNYVNGDILGKPLQNSSPQTP